jgi:hypothetical protein
VPPSGGALSLQSVGGFGEQKLRGVANGGLIEQPEEQPGLRVKPLISFLVV